MKAHESAVPIVPETSGAIMVKIVRILGFASIPLLCASRTARVHEKWFYEGRMSRVEVDEPCKKIELGHPICLSIRLLFVRFIRQANGWTVADHVRSPTDEMGWMRWR